MRSLALLLAFVAAACAKERAGGSPEAASPSTTTPASGATASAPVAAPPRPAACDGHASEIQRLLSAPGAYACKTDADCGCFNGGVVASVGCGGVASKATAEAIEKQRVAYLAAGCRQQVQCGGWRCEPRCAAGRCSR